MEGRRPKFQKKEEGSTLGPNMPGIEHNEGGEEVLDDEMERYKAILPTLGERRIILVWTKHLKGH